MSQLPFRRVFLAALLFGCVALLPSCAEREEAGSLAGGARPAAAKPAGDEAAPSWAERRAAAREERERERAAAEKVREKELEKALAEESRQEAAAARLSAAEAKKAEAERLEAEAEKRALAEREAREREERLAGRRRAVEERREDRRAAARMAEEERLARRERREQEVAAVAERGGGEGLFSRILIGPPGSQAYRSPGHHVQVNEGVLQGLGPYNARIEISISEQRLRVYRTGGGPEQLAIETQISTGKPGHATPRGSFRISEMQVTKRSTLYGTWHSASGAEVPGSHSVRHRPRGATRFVGAEMPYWMRINGGIGIHVGFVPDGPASHGCIRVPESVQPLIYSKVGVGTRVTVR